MESRTKSRLAPSVLAELTRLVMGDVLAEAVELTEGTFNVAYRLVTSDGRVGGHPRPPGARPWHQGPL